MHISCLRGDLATTRVLAKFAANVNAVDSYGNTPCHYASQYGNGEVLAFLLKFNPKLYIKNTEGKTPIDVAQNPEIIDIFGKYVNKIKQKVVSSTKRRAKTKPFIEVKKKSKCPNSPPKSKRTKFDRRLSNDFAKVSEQLERNEALTRGFDTDRQHHHKMLFPKRSRNQPGLNRVCTQVQQETSHEETVKPYSTMGDQPKQTHLQPETDLLRHQ